MKIVMCDEQNYVVIGYFYSADCVVKDRLNPVQAFTPGTCKYLSSGTYAKMTDVSLFGNKIGLGYAQGWAVFFCNVVLWGVCGGYE